MRLLYILLRIYPLEWSIFETERPSPSSRFAVSFHNSQEATLGRASRSSASAGPHRHWLLPPPTPSTRSLSSRRPRAEGSAVGVVLILLEDRSASPRPVASYAIDRGDRRRAGILDFAGDVPSSRRPGRPAGGRPGGGSVCHDEDRPGRSCQWVFPWSFGESFKTPNVVTWLVFDSLARLEFVTHFKCSRCLTQLVLNPELCWILLTPVDRALLKF